MELYRVRSKSPNGRREVVYLVATTFSDVKAFIERRKLKDPEVKIVAADYGSGDQVFDARGSRKQKEPVTPPASRPANIEPPGERERIERVKHSFSATPPGGSVGPGTTGSPLGCKPRARAVKQLQSTI